MELIAKDKPIYVQNDRDAALLRSQGFDNLTVMTDETTFGDIRITKTHGGQHGTDRAYAVPELAERLGEACGVVLRHPDEKTLYIAGDTVWRDAVAADLQKHQPDVFRAHHYGGTGSAQRSLPAAAGKNCGGPHGSH